jgi:glycosyltransferase involved in cell wall biosynthesis
MKILVLTNLYPPHHAGTFDTHCQSMTESLRMRGHSIGILTSSHGVRSEQVDREIHRRLQINGAFEHPLVTSYAQMKAMELHNTAALLEAIEEFQPDVVHVFSLRGISKSLVFTLHKSKLPVVYDVFDHWLSADVKEDPWLRFWNAPSLPILATSSRKALEVSGERGRLDDCAPTRMRPGYERLPALYAKAVEPNTIGGFRLDRIYFCSRALKQLTEHMGFCVNHAEVVYPCITSAYIGDIKPPSAPMTRFLVVGRLDQHSGVMTAVKAVKLACKAGLKIKLNIYGRGDSSYVAELRSFVVSNQLPVEFLNVSNSNSDMAAVYKGHDVLLHTPEWAEPFPFTPLEAMGCGLPVIGAVSGGAEELLHHGENSLTYPPGDAEQLAARIQELMVSPALRVQMAETAQADVMEKFNEATVMDQIENYLTASQSQTN